MSRLPGQYFALFFAFLLLAGCSSAPAVIIDAPQPGVTQAVPSRVPPTADLSEYDPTPTPTQTPMKWPTASKYFAAYDPGTQRVLLIGKKYDTSDMWAYDAVTQTLTRLKDRTSGNFDCMVFDSKAGGVSTNSQNIGKTWFYDPKIDEWKQLSSSYAVGINDLPIECPVAYDAESDRVVLITATLGEKAGSWKLVTLSYNVSGDVWEKVDIEDPVPPYAFAGAMAYDSESDLVIYWDAAVVKRMWSFDANSAVWTEIPYSGGPNKGGGFGAMVYVPDLDRIYVYYQDQFYAYDTNTNTWEKAEGDLLPGSRTAQAMAYDPLAKKIVVYGGVTESGTLLDDLWLYDPQSGVWNEQTKP
jgi:hypothetical protein